VWLGFSEDHVRRIVSESGFDEVTVIPLSPDAKAKGPGLFVATAQKAPREGHTERKVVATTVASERASDDRRRGGAPPQTKTRSAALSGREEET